MDVSRFTRGLSPKEEKVFLLAVRAIKLGGRRAYRQLMAANHPDQGGQAWKARLISLAYEACKQ